ncbi:hypothetical protein EV174_000212 [Coemansia sp. RSA 2320]|nr:hypothetical protein EV174_000212 [Coemansia sp. RSA 2320]
MAQLTAAERAHACQEQVGFCYNICKAVVSTATNFCNMRTMGWNCACTSGAGEKKVRHYEWPIAAVECRASLNQCNGACEARPNGNDRVACYTSCSADYLCNTVEAPVSSLRVQTINEKPVGYIAPADDRDIELPVGMKFGSGASELDSDSKRLQKISDPGLLPKVVPRDDDDTTGAAKAGAGKGAGSAKGAGGGGSGLRGSGPGSGFGYEVAASSSVGMARMLAGGLAVGSASMLVIAANALF